MTKTHKRRIHESAQFGRSLPHIRLLSLRAFSDDGLMIDADVAEGTALEPVIMRMFANPAVSYIHAHNAKQGCYSGRIDRA